MKQFRSWRWEEDGRARFYTLDLKGKNLVQVWGTGGVINGTRILNLDYPTEEGAWATFEALRLQAEERVGKVRVYPAAKKLFENTLYQPNKVAEAVLRGKPIKPQDTEDANMKMIKTRQLRQKAEEFQKDLELYKKIYGRPLSEKDYCSLMKFYAFLAKEGR